MLNVQLAPAQLIEEMPSCPLLVLPKSVLGTAGALMEQRYTSYGSVCSPVTPTISGTQPISIANLAYDQPLLGAEEDVSAWRHALHNDSLLSAVSTLPRQSLSELSCTSENLDNRRTRSPIHLLERAYAARDNLIGVEFACVKVAFITNIKVIIFTVYKTVRAIAQFVLVVYIHLFLVYKFVTRNT